MKFLPFLISLLLTAALTYLLTIPNPLGQDVPAIAPLLSPFDGFWQNTKVDNKRTYKNQKLAGLKEEVKIVYDDRLVPHIFAQNELDALFAQGYVTAQHRLWQMDIAVRGAGGTLSEVLGERTIDYDRLQRRRGIKAAAERAAQSWKKSPNVQLLQAYVDGVNAYMSSLSPADYPIEYKLLGYTPEAWSIEKTAIFQKNMALSLNFRYEDLAATNSLQIFGREAFDFLYPETNDKESPVIPRGTIFANDSTELLLNDSSKVLIGELLPYPDLPMVADGIGSNNWAVAGSKTASGNSILCNDPHLQMTLPAIWYEIQMHTPDYNVYGASIPGLPGVIIGFNEHIAWGSTNVGQDVTDWYAIDWVDEAQTRYRFNGKEREVEMVIEVIEVKGSSKVILDTIRYTHFGPIVYRSEDDGYHDLAMHWISLETPNPDEITIFPRINRAKNYAEFDAACASYETPAQNFVFASTDGDVAMNIVGRLPIKREEQGRFVLEGNVLRNEWMGFIPYDQNPKVLNPPRQFVASANQRTTDDTYPYPYNREGFDQYRGRYINRTLDSLSNATVKDMMNLQTSSYSLFAEEALPLMLSNLDQSQLNALQKGLVELLESWDYVFEKEAVAPILFTEWFEDLEEATWDEISAYADSISVLQVRKWRTVDMLENHPLNVFWDITATPERETPEDIVTQAFLSTIQDLEWRLQDKEYTWEAHRKTYIAHLSRSLEPFGRYNISTNGYSLSPNAVSRTAGPSWRMIVEMSETPKGYGVYPGGQSGNPASRFYDSMIDTWANEEYYELSFLKTPEELEEKRLYDQLLKPN
ncbi:MAG: penicillin acylase family protein [Bacteroidota bacterium]